MKHTLTKRALAALMTLVMLLGTAAMLPASADAETTYDITIDSPAGLVAMQSAIDALTDKTTVFIQLTADIDMSAQAYVPVTTEKTIVFEGNNHKISNLTVGTAVLPAENAGLFAQIGVESSASNLTLENVDLHASKSAAGFAATALYGDYEFYNIHVSGTITSHHPDKMGVDTGIAAGVLGWIPCVGEQLGVATCVRVSYCTNAANITADSTAGGIVGKLTGPSSIQAYYCANTGNLTATGVSDTARYFNGDVGGIIALSFHEWSTNAAWVYNYFENCYNTGDLSATTHATAEAPSIAGISGVIRCYGIGGMSPAPAYENELAFYNCFDYSRRTAIIPASVPSNAHTLVLNYTHNAGIAGFCADYEIPQKFFTNCYSANKAGSTSPYSAVHSGRNISLTTSGVVDSAEVEIPLTTGNATILDMIARIDRAIAELGEIVMPVNVITDGMERDYSWYYANGALTDKGTKDAPYEIATAAQLAALSALSNGQQDPAAVGGITEAVSFHNKYFKLTADIDMTGYGAAPINAKNATVFFEGNTKKISNWNIEKTSNGGVFGTLGRGSTVRNLTLSNVDVSAYGESGTLVGLAQAGLTISNIKTNAACKVVTAGRIGGGIIGSISDAEALPGDEETEGDVVKIAYCVNETDVTSLEVVGGIVGHMKGTFDYRITNCVNKGDLLGNREVNATYYLGGMIGFVEMPKEPLGCYNNTIAFCYNTGDIATKNTTGNCWVGGIAGYLSAQIGSEIVIESCYDVSARKVSTTSGTGLRNAGLVGNAEGGYLTKFMWNCAAANAADSDMPFADTYLWTKTATSLVEDETVLLVADVNAEIVDLDGATYTLKAAMTKIDQAIAKKASHPFDDCQHAYSNDCDATCNECGESRTPSAHVYDNDSDDTCNECGVTRTVQTPSDNGTQTQKPADETTAAPEETTATPAEEKKGCGSALNSTYAILALVAVLGFAFVAKKKEEN